MYKIKALQTGNTKNPALSRRSKYMPSRGLYLENKAKLVNLLKL